MVYLVPATTIATFVIVRVPELFQEAAGGNTFDDDPDSRRLSVVLVTDPDSPLKVILVGTLMQEGKRGTLLVIVTVMVLLAQGLELL